MSQAKRPTAALTVDLDTTRFYRDIHGLPARGRPDALDAAYALGTTRLLKLCQEFGMSATLCVIGEDAEQRAQADLLRQAHADGHELANHTYHHRYDLRARHHAIIVQDIARGERAIEAITGNRPVGFRTPGYNVDAQIFEILEQRGYLYDSSVFPCPPYYVAKGAIMGWMRLRGEPSRSMMTPAPMMGAPTRAYRPHSGSIWRASPSSHRMWEVPMCVVPGVRFPVIGTSLHVLGERGFGAVYPLLRARYRRLLQLEFHAIDFMDARDEGVEDLVGVQPDLRIPWARKRARYGAIFERIARDYTWRTLAQGVRAL